MRILVTGASGLLGVNLALELSQQHLVFGTVNKNEIKIPAAFRERTLTLFQTDLLAPGAVEQVLDRTQPDWVIHCAALANLDACEANPELAHQLNSVIPAKLADHVGRGGARLAHISTDAVFDGRQGNYVETDVPNPLGVYATTKLAGEWAVAQANPQAIIARVNLYGWSLSGKRSLAEFFFNNLQAGNSVMGFTDVIFGPLLANDMAWILAEMLEKRLAGVYHLVGGEWVSKYAFGVALAERFGFDSRLIRPVSWQEAGLKAARSPNLSLRTEKLAQALGKPLPNLSAGLNRFYILYQQGYPQVLQSMVDPH